MCVYVLQEQRSEVVKKAESINKRLETPASERAALQEQLAKADDKTKTAIAGRPQCRPALSCGPASARVLTPLQVLLQSDCTMQWLFGDLEIYCTMQRARSNAAYWMMSKMLFLCVVTLSHVL